MRKSGSLIPVRFNALKVFTTSILLTLFLKKEFVRKTATNSAAHSTAKLNFSFKNLREITLLDIYQSGREHQQKNFITLDFSHTTKVVTKLG